MKLVLHRAEKSLDVGARPTTNLTGTVEVPRTTHPVLVQPPKKKRREHAFTGFIDFQGLKIDVENRLGETRSGVDGDGKPWSTEMVAGHYGEIRNTEGTDSDALDVYVGPNHDSSLVVVIHQFDPQTAEYDEDKCMLGYDSVEEAIGAYKKQYDRPGFYHDGEYEALPIGAFWRWVHDGRKRGFKIDAEKLVGGRADGMTDADFDADALAAGTKHEREHTNDEATAREIARDHLAEDPAYYTKLAKMEATMGDADKSIHVGARDEVAKSQTIVKVGPRGGQIIGYLHGDEKHPIYAERGAHVAPHPSVANAGGWSQHFVEGDDRPHHVFVPHHDWVRKLQVGDTVPDPMNPGKVTTVSDIHYRGEDKHGAPYVGFSVPFGDRGTISSSFKGGKPEAGPGSPLLSEDLSKEGARVRRDAGIPTPAIEHHDVWADSAIANEQRVVQPAPEPDPVVQPGPVVQPVEIAKPPVDVGRDPRLPAPGTTISREYQGKRVEVVERDGKFHASIDGADAGVHTSLSKVATSIAGSSQNGYAWFKLGAGQKRAAVEKPEPAVVPVAVKPRGVDVQNIGGYSFDAADATRDAGTKTMHSAMKNGHTVHLHHDGDNWVATARGRDITATHEHSTQDGAVLGASKKWHDAHAQSQRDATAEDARRELVQRQTADHAHATKRVDPAPITNAELAEKYAGAFKNSRDRGTELVRSQYISGRESLRPHHGVTDTGEPYVIYATKDSGHVTHKGTVIRNPAKSWHTGRINVAWPTRSNPNNFGGMVIDRVYDKTVLGEDDAKIRQHDYALADKYDAIIDALKSGKHPYDASKARAKSAPKPVEKSIFIGPRPTE
jgi:hypothetical protein